MPEFSSFVSNLVKVALAEFNTYAGYNEEDEFLCKQVKKYWQSVGQTVNNCSDQAWSAVFISYCVRKAGATETEFKFADNHSVFVKAAIANETNQTGVFRGVKIDNYAPKIGDIIHLNREGNSYDYNYAKNNSGYPSHTAIVVEINKNIFGHYAITIGGNESDSIQKTRVKLDRNGFVKQKRKNPYICIIKTLK